MMCYVSRPLVNRVQYSSTTTRMAPLSCVFTFLYFTVPPVQSVTFHLPPPTTFLHSCTPQGSWAVKGNVTLTEADMEVFSHNLTFQVQGQQMTMCTIDLWSCPTLTSPMTSPSTLSPEVCECLGMFSENDYSVYVRRSIYPSEAGLLLTAAFPAVPEFSPIQTTFDIGKLPAATSGNMTYIVDGGDPTPLMSSQNITACKDVPMKLEVCVQSAQPGTILKLSGKGQTISTPQTCVHITEDFSFQDKDSYPVVFTYDEGAGCPFQDQFLLNVFNDQSMCAPKTTPPASTTSTTSSSSCKEAPTSLARQPVTLSNGLKVLCDTQTDGGDWVVIQRRTRGDVDFYRRWTEYVGGFGNITGDFWMGLQDIHSICPPTKPCTLRIDMKDPQHNNGDLFYAQFTNFSLRGWTDKYRLTVGNYTGTTGDKSGYGLPYSNHQQFSTKTMRIMKIHFGHRVGKYDS